MEIRFSREWRCAGVVNTKSKVCCGNQVCLVPDPVGSAITHHGWCAIVCDIWYIHTASVQCDSFAHLRSSLAGVPQPVFTLTGENIDFRRIFD